MYIANLLVNHRASRTTYNNIRKKKLVTYGNTVVLFLKTIRYMFSLPTKLLCKHNLSCNGKAPNTLMVIVTRYFGKKNIYIYIYTHTWRGYWSNCIAYCTTNISGSPWIKKDIPTSIAHKLALHPTISKITNQHAI